MINKTYNISLDMKNPASVPEQICLVEGDSGNVFVVTLTDAGAAVDLTGCLVLAVFSKPDGTTVEQDSEGHGIEFTNNIITIELYSTSFSPGEADRGKINCEIQVYSGIDHGTLVTSAQFNFDCRRSITNQDTIQAVEEYPILTSLIASTTIAIEDCENAASTARSSGQADWTEADITSNKYIQHKPIIPTAPSDIGAAAAEHASRHGTGGADALSPADIGALPSSIVPSDIGAAPALQVLAGTLLSTAWTGTEAPYTQTVAVTGMTASASGVIGLPDTATAQQREAARSAMLFLTAKGTDSVTISADGDAPETDIPFEIQIGG